jgi:hypothetical protein
MSLSAADYAAGEIAVEIDIPCSLRLIGADQTNLRSRPSSEELTQLEQFGGGFYDFSIAEGVRSKG